MSVGGWGGRERAGAGGEGERVGGGEGGRGGGGWEGGRGVVWGWFSEESVGGGVVSE